MVGASGSGKSSLLRAGVIPAVETGGQACARSVRLITPGAAPTLDLGGDPAELLIVDQFEEIYTQCCDPERRAAFIDVVLSRPGAVTIGVRADFYGEISRDRGLAAAAAGNQVLLGPMGDEDLRRAIAEPARLTGLRLEPGLIDLVLRDVAGEPGALPLMSHALQETWERRDGRTLSIEAYRKSGGVSSALARSADAVVDHTPEAQRHLLRNIFVRLTGLGHGVEDTRRRVPIEELVPSDASAAEVHRLLERLADARLVILDEGTAEVAHEVLIRRWPTLRGWLEEDLEGIRLHRRLGDAARIWDAAGRETADLYRGARLGAALEWARGRGEVLNDVEQSFLETSAEESSRGELRQRTANRRLWRALAVSGGLLGLCIALLLFALDSRHDAIHAEASARSQALATEAEGQVDRDPQLALLLARTALASAPTPEAELAASEALDANTMRAQLPSLGVQGCADSNYLVLMDGGRLAADDTCDGYVVFADLAARRILRRVRVGADTTDMVLDGSGGALIVASGHDLFALDMRTGSVRRIFTAPFEIEQVAGPPGRYLAIADRGEIALADPRTGRLRIVARADPSVNGVNGMMAASPDLLLVASTGQSRGHGDLLPRLTALNVFNGHKSTVRLATPPEIASVVFLRVSPDGRRWYVTGAEVNNEHDNEVAVTWAIDARTGRLSWVAEGPSGAFASPVQVSPDGRLLAVGYSTGAADVLDAATGRLVERISSGSTVASGDLAIAAGDKMLVTASLDGLMRIWSTHGSERARLQAPAGAAVDFAPDGRDLVILGTKGELVSLQGRVLRRFPGFAAGAVVDYCNSCYSATPSLARLSYIDPTGLTPRIIEIEGTTGRRVGSVTVPTLEAQGVAPDGQIVAAWVEGGRLDASLSSLAVGRTRMLPSGPSNPGCIATTPAFDGDGGLMAIADGCTHVVVWDMRRDRVLRTIDLPEHASGPATLSRDGRWALVPMAGGSFVRASLPDGRLTEVPGEHSPVDALAISPTGRFYAVGREDGTVDEYDARTLRLIRRHMLISPIESLVFSRTGEELAVEDTTGVVRVWDSCSACENAGRLAQLAAAASVRTLTTTERQTFGVP